MRTRSVVLSRNFVASSNFNSSSNQSVHEFGLKSEILKRSLVVLRAEAKRIQPLDFSEAKEWALLLLSDVGAIVSNLFHGRGVATTHCLVAESFDRS